MKTTISQSETTTAIVQRDYCRPYPNSFPQIFNDPWWPQVGQGWQCPICRTVWAPSIIQCTCHNKSAWVNKWVVWAGSDGWND